MDQGFGSITEFDLYNTKVVISVHLANLPYRKVRHLHHKVSTWEMVSVALSKTVAEVLVVEFSISLSSSLWLLYSSQLLHKSFFHQYIYTLVVEAQLMALLVQSLSLPSLTFVSRIELFHWAVWQQLY